ncbi:MAG: type II toxin-antitoxin system VapB family antitoxin [Actinomycetota bacterium]
MRTTINISDNIVREAEALYGTKNRSRAIENAIRDAVRFHKLKELMSLKSKISFDEDRVRVLREMEKEEL